jgi:acetyltransferase-like isoleucine patch superfamily enzyme
MNKIKHVVFERDEYMRPPIAVRLRNNLRNALSHFRIWIYRTIWKMDIGPNCKISLKAHLDKSNPRGLHIGRDTGIAFGAAILSHNHVGNRHQDTWIGERCHIGPLAIILPGVRIGDGSVVAPGSVVMRDVPEGSLVSGNPARVFEKGIKTAPGGRIIRNDG